MLAKDSMAGGVSAGAAIAINGSVNPTVTAAGSTITDATQLTASHNNITICTAGQGVLLYNGVISDEMFIYNTTTTPCSVYPPSATQTINQLPVGIAMILEPYTGCKYKKATSTAWAAFLSA